MTSQPIQLQPEHIMTWLIAFSIGFAADTLIALWLTLSAHPDWLEL